MVVFQVQMKKLKDFNKSFDEFIIEAEEYFEHLLSRTNTISEEEIPEGMKFKEYLPAYEAKQAYSKYILHKEPKSTKWIKVKPKD